MDAASAARYFTPSELLGSYFVLALNRISDYRNFRLILRLCHCDV